MINYDYMDDMMSDSAHKNLIITDGAVAISGSSYSVSGQTVLITNDLINEESFELNQSLCSSNRLEYGSCEAAECSFTIFDNIPSIKGKTLKVYIYIDDDAATMLQLGIYKVAQDKLTADRTKREVVMYDAMYDIINSDVAAWYKTLLPSSSSSTTMQAFRASFLSHFGITAESKILANDAMTIKQTLNPDSLSGADVIRAICEINGCFGTITHEGKFRFFELSPGADDGLFPSDTLYPANDLYPQDVNPNTTSIAKSLYTSVQFEDYNSESITKLTIKTSETIGVSVGTDGNEYVITSNFLVSDKNTSQLTSIANNALTKMINRYYKPAVVECVGNPCHELGDPIRINTVYRGVVTYILERSLKGIQNLTDTYTAQGEQYYEKDVNGIVSKFEQIEDKTLKIQADVNGIETEVNDLAEQTTSRLSILSDRIDLKVSQGQIMNGLASETAYSAIQINPNSIQVSSSGTFTVDSSNFKLTSSGFCEMGNCLIKGGTVSLGTVGSTQLWIDLDRGFQMSDGSNFAYLQEGYLAITAYHAYGDRTLRFDSSGLTLSDNAVVTVSEFNVPNGGVGASKTQRSIYWRKASSLGNDEYVLCGEHV